LGVRPDWKQNRGSNEQAQDENARILMAIHMEKANVTAETPLRNAK
jgi:hypothetical protein